jgi:predicted N-formylglutamate amidohydrolase
LNGNGTLLEPGDPAPVGLENPAGRSPILFVSDHAGRAIPSRLGRLGHHTEARPWHIGVIAVHDWRIGDPLIALLEVEGNLCVGRNQPYGVNMAADYTIPIHCEGGMVPYVEIEIRQDLIGDEKGQQEWAERLARIFPLAVARAAVAAA